jgi:hypothetical protein
VDVAADDLDGLRAALLAGAGAAAEGRRLFPGGVERRLLGQLDAPARSSSAPASAA